jgi:hypothetical protein
LGVDLSFHSNKEKIRVFVKLKIYRKKRGRRRRGRKQKDSGRPRINYNNNERGFRNGVLLINESCWLSREGFIKIRHKEFK